MSQKIAIMHVDDNPSDLEFFEEALIESNKGLDLINGFEALNKIQKISNDLLYTHLIIFIDIKMPVLSDTELIKNIRNSKKSLINIICVVLSSSKMPETIFDSYKVGTNGYIVKPSSYNNIIKKIKPAIKFYKNCIK